MTELSTCASSTRLERPRSYAKDAFGGGVECDGWWKGAASALELRRVSGVTKKSRN